MNHSRIPVFDLLLSDLELILERSQLEQERTGVRGGNARQCAGSQLFNLMPQSALTSSRRSHQLIHHFCPEIVIDFISASLSCNFSEEDRSADSASWSFSD